MKKKSQIHHLKIFPFESFRLFVMIRQPISVLNSHMSPFSDSQYMDGWVVKRDFLEKQTSKEKTVYLCNLL